MSSVKNYTGKVTYTWHATIVTKQKPVYGNYSNTRRRVTENDVYTKLAGLRVHKRSMTAHIVNVFAGYENASDVILRLNELLKDENVSTNPHLSEYEALLKSLMISDDGLIAQLFSETVSDEDSSFLFWYHLCEDGDWWRTAVPTLKNMPSYHMMRYVTERLCTKYSVGFNERVDVISKREDNFGMPKKLLRRALTELYNSFEN